MAELGMPAKPRLRQQESDNYQTNSKSGGSSFNFTEGSMNLPSSGTAYFFLTCA